MVMALGALVVGGSGSRKYTHFWQEFQTNRKLSTYIQHTPKNKRNTSFILMTMWIWWEKCALPPTNSSFSNFHHHCRNCMNYRLDEVVMSKPPFWKQIVFAYSITEGRWLELVDWVVVGFFQIAHLIYFWHCISFLKNVNACWVMQKCTLDTFLAYLTCCGLFLWAPGILGHNHLLIWWQMSIKT